MGNIWRRNTPVCIVVFLPACSFFSTKKNKALCWWSFMLHLKALVKSGQTGSGGGIRMRPGIFFRICLAERSCAAIFFNAVIIPNTMTCYFIMCQEYLHCTLFVLLVQECSFHLFHNACYHRIYLVEFLLQFAVGQYAGS